MHIVIANQWFPPESGWGGIGMYNYEVAHAYHELGHTVTVIASRLSEEIPARKETNGIKVLRILIRDMYFYRRIPFVGRYVRPIQQMGYARQVDRMLRELHRVQPIDVIEFAEINAEGVWYSRAPEVPIVVRCHTPTFVLRRYYSRREMPYDTSISSCLEKIFIRRAHALTAPSRDMANVISAACNLPIEQIVVIPNALNVNDELVACLPRSQDPVIILHIGRLDRVKGVVVLSEAIKQVAAKYPNVHTVFIGEDRATARGTSQRGELEAQLRQAGLGGAVEFCGTVDQSTLIEWYRRADVCVVPSQLYESFSYTCAQAMAAGRAIVGSRIGGIPETIEEGVSGLLVEPGDVNQLAGALMKLVNDRSMRESMGKAGHARAKAYFDPIKVAQQNIAVYENARRNFLQSVAHE